MRIIGLTGGTGSGKGAVSKCLKELGAAVIDSDEVAHEIIVKGKPAYNELIDYFGTSILDENGDIVRRILGEIVFSDGKEKLRFLNQCTHKYIFLDMKEQLESYEKEGREVVVIDAPLLLEGKFKTLCDEVWVVYADEKTRLNRIMDRDSISEEHGKNRIASQKTWDEYKAEADIIIDNNGNLAQLREQVIKNYKVK